MDRVKVNPEIAGDDRLLIIVAEHLQRTGLQLRGLRNIVPFRPWLGRLRLVFFRVIAQDECRYTYIVDPFQRKKPNNAK